VGKARNKWLGGETFTTLLNPQLDLAVKEDSGNHIKDHRAIIFNWIRIIFFFFSSHAFLAVPNVLFREGPNVETL
jgi:hypothetical protein